MNRIASYASLIIGLVAVIFAINYVADSGSWQSSVFNFYALLPIAMALLFAHVIMHITTPNIRHLSGKVIQLLIYGIIGIWIFELWQNSASFPPISVRQYIVEISKLLLMYCAAVLILWTLRRITQKKQ